MAAQLERATSRRRFLQFLAASPLLAHAGLPVLAQGSAPPADGLIASAREALNVFEFEPVMRRNVAPVHFAYAATGSDDEATLRANREGFGKFQLRPRRLVDVSQVDMGVEILGTRYASPIVLAPTASNTAFHREGEVAVAKAARAGNHLQMLSTVATTAVEAAMPRGAPVWFQLYATQKWEVPKPWRNGPSGPDAGAGGDRRRAGAAELGGLSPGAAGRCGAVRRLPRGDLSRFRGPQAELRRPRPRRRFHLGRHQPDLGPISVCATRQDEVRAQGHSGARGRAAGRASRGRRHHRLQPWRARRGQRARTIEALPEIVEAAGGRMPVLVDGGFRRGTDIVKALALGAAAVAIGRPYLWGLGAFGQAGVERVLEILRAETRFAMQQLGAPTIRDLVPAMVRRA